MDIRDDTRLTKRFFKHVDTSGPCHVWTATLNRGGYGSFNVDGKVRSAHRIAYMLAYGDFDQSKQVDHICHNRACQNPRHLRLVTAKQNAENLSGARVDSKSGVRGVTWHKQSKKWWAHVGHNGRVHSGGLYHSLTEAAESVRALRNSLHTHNDLDRRPDPK